MKRWRKYLIGLAVAVMVMAALVWFLPARWVMPWIAPQLHGLRLQQVHGALWAGSADRISTADGKVWGRLQWQLSRRALLGQVELSVQFDGPQLAFAGDMRRWPDKRIEWQHVRARFDLAALEARVSSPFGQPLGEVLLTIDHAVLQGGWPLQLQAQAHWRDAVVRTREGDISLGELQLQAQARDGVIQADLHDVAHGPLQALAQLQLSPLGWRLDATLRSRQTDPALRHWLAGLGPPDADGGVRLQRSGGLAATLPAPSSDKDATPP